MAIYFVTLYIQEGDNWKSFYIYMYILYVKAHIMCVRDVVLSEPFRGQIRKEDVRATEKDKVEMYKSYR